MLALARQIKFALFLAYQQARAKRPRLTVSLSPADYELLAEKYDLNADQQLEIKRKLMDDLVMYVKNQQD